MNLSMVRNTSCTGTGSLTADIALVKHLDQIAAKKEWDVDNLISTNWEAVSPCSDDLTRSSNLKVEVNADFDTFQFTIFFPHLKFYILTGI
jgi:hypothetical protein